MCTRQLIRHGKILGKNVFLSHSRVEYLCDVYNALDEHHIILHVILFVENAELCKLRAARGNIHVRNGLLEGT